MSHEPLPLTADELAAFEADHAHRLLPGQPQRLPDCATCRLLATLVAARASRPEPKDATPEPCGFCGRSREACESWRSGVWPCCGLCDHAKRADGAQEWTITEPAASRPEPKDDDLAGQLASRMRRIESIALGGITGDDGASRCDAILSIVLDEVQPLLAARVPVSPPDPEGLRAALHGAQIAMLNDPETRCITDDDGHMERFIPAHVAIRETNRARAAIQASPASALTAALDVEDEA